MSDSTLKIIKYISLSIIIVTGILLIFMYFQMFKIREFTNKLDSQLYDLTIKEEQLNKYKENLLENKDNLIEDYLRKDLSMIKKDETLIKY